MKKKTVKAVSIIAMALMMLMGLGACVKSECFFCSEVKSCKTYNNAYFGEIDVCKDCKPEILEFFE